VIPEEVRQLLQEGERALEGGNTEEALALARRSQRTKLTVAAASLTARAHCRKKDLGNTLAVLRTLSPAEKPRVMRYCKQYLDL
jgi:serine/threonine-protein kinase